MTSCETPTLFRHHSSPTITSSSDGPDPFDARSRDPGETKRKISNRRSRCDVPTADAAADAAADFMDVDVDADAAAADEHLEEEEARAADRRRTGGYGRVN